MQTLYVLVWLYEFLILILLKAKKEAEAAIASGVIESKLIIFIYKTDHPVKTIQDWYDKKLGASMESIMDGYNDPRRAQFFHNNRKQVISR